MALWDVFRMFSGLGGLAYLGVGLAKEAAEKQENIDNAELSRKFIAKYTDPVLKASLRAQIEDPTQYDAVWERIEWFKKNYHEVRAIVPVELFDPHSFKPKPTFYTDRSIRWDEIGTRRRELWDQYGNQVGMYAQAISDTLNWLMYTYGKFTVGCAREFSAAYNSESLRYIRRYMMQERRSFFDTPELLDDPVLSKQPASRIEWADSWMDEDLEKRISGFLLDRDASASVEETLTQIFTEASVCGEAAPNLKYVPSKYLPDEKLVRLFMANEGRIMRQDILYGLSYKSITPDVCGSNQYDNCLRSWINKRMEEFGNPGRLHLIDGKYVWLLPGECIDGVEYNDA